MIDAPDDSPLGLVWPDRRRGSAFPVHAVTTTTDRIVDRLRRRTRRLAGSAAARPESAIGALH